MRIGFITVLFMFGCASAPSASSHANDPDDPPAEQRGPHDGLELDYDPTDATLEAVSPDGVPADSADTLRLMAVGDIMLGSTYPHINGRDLPRIEAAESPAGLMEPFADLLRSADLTIGNLEGVLAAHDEPGTRPKCHHAAKGCFAFRMPPELGAHLVAAGFDVMSLANNHILDFGEKAREATQRHLDQLGIAHTGQRGDIARLVVGGRRVSVIGMSVYDHSYNLNELDLATEVIAAEAAAADIVVVSIHAGGEGPDSMRIPHGPERFLGRNRGDLRRFSRAAIDAGADLIVGHGPHVPRAIELYKGRLVAYSLGNFATWKRFNLAGPNGLAFILDVRLDREGAFVSGRAHPIRQLGLGGPLPDPDGSVLPILGRLSREDFPDTGVVVTPDGTLLGTGDPVVDVRTGAPVVDLIPRPPSPAPEPPGAKHLDKLHPYLRHLGLELHRRAFAAGIPFRFIHGYATYKPRKSMGPGGMANWHQFGLAFDILIADRKSITDGTNHFGADDPQWRVLGTIAAELGLVWGGSWRSSYDPFHFEWHPGDDPVINPADLRRLLAKAGPDGRDLQAVWTLYPAPRGTGSTLAPTIVSDP